MDFNIDNLIGTIDFHKNSMNDLGNNIFLTNFEIEVLDKYGIDYKNSNNLKSIIFMIEEILNEDSSLEDLEIISKSIAERDYYLNTNK